MTGWICVEPRRLEGWLGRFGERHGQLRWQPDADLLVVTAEDGTTAQCRVPLVPLVPTDAPFAGLIEHVLTERRVGVLLVRLGGHAAGVFQGDALLSSKVGSRQVHGRSAAGGQSQQRFARRREGQVRVALTAAADVAVRVLLPAVDDLDVVVLGGDRQALATVLQDRRLTRIGELASDRVLDIPDPRLKVLQHTPDLFRGTLIRVVEPS